MWICTACGADVQADWEVCWQCSRPRDGAITERLDPTARAAALTPQQCTNCSAETLIPMEPIESGAAWPIVVTTPELRGHSFLPGEIRGTMRVWVCGTCGHVAWIADNPHELWESYLRAQAQFPNYRPDADPT